MYRSGSANKFSEDHYSYYTSSPSSKVPTALRSLTQQHGIDELPIYEPLSEAAKKDRTRTRVSENAVHLIPLILLLCIIILWFSSNSDVDLKRSSIAGNIQGISSQGHLDSDGTGHLPMNLGDMDPAKLRDAKTRFSLSR